ncbi:hypothetical protein [Candidatus Odyssella thessalonicensis]|uniref:hypothetical protein n=1 Tax=Candidatus Odyssella thessalonicensis TaxID=84647 RepID=UPI000225B1E8|nr:hypothetical protein [Candidatus Odyssella thessalonicensis]
MRKIITTAFGLLLIQLSSSAMEGGSAAEINLCQAMGTLKAGELVTDKRLIGESLESFKEIAIESVKQDNVGKDTPVLSIITLWSLKTHLSKLYDDQYFKTLSSTKRTSYLFEMLAKACMLSKKIKGLLLEYSDPATQAQLYFIKVLCKRKTFELNRRFSKQTGWGANLLSQRLAKINRASAKALSKVVKFIATLQRPTLPEFTLQAIALKNLEALTSYRIKKVKYLRRLREIVINILADDDFDAFFSKVPNFELIEGTFETVGNSLTRLGFYDQVVNKKRAVNINLLYRDYPNLIFESIEERIKQLAGGLSKAMHVRAVKGPSIVGRKECPGTKAIDIKRDSSEI